MQEIKVIAKNTFKTVKIAVIIFGSGADAVNISGLLNPKKSGNFKNQML